MKQHEVFYAVAISAMHIEGCRAMKAGMVWAYSDEEAMGKALNLARIEWPIEEDWRNHGAAYYKVPGHWTD